jgi:hypothetical protein
MSARTKIQYEYNGESGEVVFDDILDVVAPAADAVYAVADLPDGQDDRPVFFAAAKELMQVYGGELESRDLGDWPPKGALAALARLN